MSGRPRIYCWVNSGAGTDFQTGVAIAEDGTGLAAHISSNDAWARHDMGAGSCHHRVCDCDRDRKHDLYAGHYPDGFEVVWVDDFHSRLRDDPRFAAAVAANQAKTEAARKAATAGA